jgi:hypothetical protein
LNNPGTGTGMSGSASTTNSGTVGGTTR